MSQNEIALRAAAQAVIDRWETPLWKDAPPTGEFIYALRDALHAPEVSGSAPEMCEWTYCIHRVGNICCKDRDKSQAPVEVPGSEYDKAVEALAPYLPDGWVAQGFQGFIVWTKGEPEVTETTGLVTDSTQVYLTGANSALTIPRCPDWRASLRRIEKGKVTQ